jgi:hypothetical protein
VVAERKSLKVRVWKALESAGQMFVEYGDVVLAAALAVVVAVEVIFFDLEGDKLTEATAALLGILSFALVRERWTRRKGFDEFHDTLRDIQAKAQSVQGDAGGVRSAAESAAEVARHTEAAVSDALGVLAGEKPYDVLASEFSWEMLTCDGREAKAVTVRDLRFTADNVYCIYEHSWASGTSSVGECRGKVGDEEKDLPVMHSSFPGPEGKRFTVISLEDFLKRGQRMTITATRKIEDSFTDTREFVTVNVESPTDRIEVEVIWPADCNLRSVEVERTGSSPGKQAWKLDDLDEIDGGRRRLLYPVERPVLRDAIFVIWEWDGAAATGVEASIPASPQAS